MQPTKYKMGYLCVYGCVCLPVCVNGKGVGKSWFHSSFCIKCFLGEMSSVLNREYIIAIHKTNAFSLW